MIRSAWAGLVLAVLTLTGVGAAAPLPASAADTCSGVWVVVDYGSLGGIDTACATSYSTGTAALRSAGFSPTLDGGMITKISGKPGTVDLNSAYWSYWHATPKSDGTWSSWSYSNLGGNSYHPKQGNAEGWRYQGLNDGKVSPGAAPPKAQVVPTPTPTPTPTKTKTTPKPTPTKSSSATAKASSTATASAKQTPSSATATASPSATASPTASGVGTSSVPTPAATVEATEVAQQQVTGAQPASDNGSPVGAIVAGAAVVVAATGMGGWWLWKGRKP